MKKNKRSNKAATEPAGTVAPTVEVKVETPAEQAASEPVYGLIATPEDLEKRPVRKGFETVLITELANGAGTVQQLTDRLLASGEYARVAPKAAELRPTKPVQFLLTRWAGSGRVAIASAEEAAAVINAGAAPAQIEAGEPATDVPAASEEPAATTV
jgi:hypothetical protein